MNRSATNLARKIETLSSDQIEEVEHFVEFLHFRAQDRINARASTAVSEPVFEKIWNNPEDDAYDAL